jgi:hypothetical protein
MESAIESKQVAVKDYVLQGAENKADFLYVRAFEHVKSIYANNGFGKVESRDALVKKLDSAISEAQSAL